MAKKTVPVSVTFDKDLFKRSVLYNIKTLYRKTLEEATPQQVFQAVAYAIKDAVVDNWMRTQEEYEKQDPKTVYYLSKESSWKHSTASASQIRRVFTMPLP